LLRVDVLQLAPVLDALTAHDWVGRTSDPAQSAADDPEPRYVLLADPERTLLEPLLQRLLLDRSGSLEPLWDSAGLAQLHLLDLLQKE
jgi:membrane protein